MTHEFLLLHEHFVGAVVDDTFAENRCGKVLHVRLYPHDNSELTV
jgi:hypothetical protein